MKAHLKTATSLSFVLILFLPTTGVGQQRYDSGPYKGFIREEPELNKILIDEPFRVARVEGIVNYPPYEPLAEVCFEIRDRFGRVLSSLTNDKGMFRIPNVTPGTYEFKATRNKFYSVVGRVVVSPKAPQNKSIRLQLQLGT